MNKDELMNQILDNKDVNKIVKTNKLSADELSNNLTTLYSFIVDYNKCTGCKGLNQCKQFTVGKEPKLNYNGYFSISYVDCPFVQKINKKVNMQNSLLTYGCDINLDEKETLFMNVNRNELYNKAKIIYDKFMNCENPKGLFIYGPYGCGKTYFLKYYTKMLIKDGATVVFAYFPDLIRTIKSSVLIEGAVEEIIDNLKAADVLILDDFGGETMTPYIRDEVLGSVLQDRMERKALTFITSNLSPETLHQHLMESTKDIDELRAQRIEERIKSLMEFVPLNDINYRQ